MKMQGPSELGLKGTLENWDRTDRAERRSRVPTLVMAATSRHDGSGVHADDVRAPAQRSLPRVPNGSHLAIFDDQETYFGGLIDFIRDVDAPLERAIRAACDTDADRLLWRSPATSMAFRLHVNGLTDCAGR